MKPSTHTVQEAFERDVRYAVPLYQRPYVWNEKDQWAPLWDDISALLDHQASEGYSSLWSHFLGAIVLDQEQTVPGQIPSYTVIDGQQRLTTLQLLLAAAGRALTEVGATGEGSLLRELVSNNPLKTKGSHQLKVWPTNANRAAFEAMMAPDGPPSGYVNDPGNLIDEAFAYFFERAREYLTGVDHEDITDGEEAAEAAAEVATPAEEGPDPAVAARAQLLRITLCDLLKLVSIVLEDDDNAQVIFETLNARGTPLLALDLVKNAIFRQVAHADAPSETVDRLYEHVWQPELERAYWRERRRQGRLFRPAGELFLMHWLTMRLERVIPATELFATFREQVLGTGADAEALIGELCADAKVMRGFDHPKPGSPEAEFFARFTALDASTVLPVILLLFRSPEVPLERRRRAVRILESWLARRALMRLTAKNYNRLVPRLVAHMKKDLAHADDALLAALSGGEGEISRWPETGEFVQFLRTREVYGTVSQPRLIMALAAVEASLYSSKVDVPQLAEELSLEHLLPQQWEQHWPPIDQHGVPLEGQPLEEVSEAREAGLHRLGNLTIVTQPLNAAMSNAPWEQKRQALNAHSKLLLNARLAGRDHWDERTIEERGAWLADRLASIWPGPDPSDWS